MNQTLKTWNKIIVLTALLIALPLLAWAKPDIAISIKAEKEIIVTENGKQVKKIVEAKEIFPGEIITYVLSYENKGNEVATNITLNDPIPEGTTYLTGSASETGDLSFSIDGGINFKKPSFLTYETEVTAGKKEKRIASPEQYTHIRWLIPKLGAGESGKALFKVKVK